jgi:hypothetical protein
MWTAVLCLMSFGSNFQERFGDNLERRWKADLEVSKKEKEVLKRVERLTTNERIDKGGILHLP